MSPAKATTDIVAAGKKSTEFTTPEQLVTDFMADVRDERRRRREGDTGR